MQSSLSLQFLEGPAEQEPEPHVSFSVQPLPSEQDPAVATDWQPSTLSQESAVQPLASSQGSAPEPTHEPPEHPSLGVHTLPSVHGAPLAKCRQPLVLLQSSSVQGLLSSQSSGTEPTQLPAVHTSWVVQAFASLQAAVLASWVQPAVLSQASVVQGLLSLQLAGLEPTHAPPEHASLVVHTLLSLQDAVLLVDLQPLPMTQLSLVHGLLSLQTTALPPH